MQWWRHDSRDGCSEQNSEFAHGVTHCRNDGGGSGPNTSRKLQIGSAARRGWRKEAVWGIVPNPHKLPMSHVAKLIEHLAWADERVLASLRQADTVLPAALGLHAHILGAEHVWYCRIRGSPPKVAVWPELSLDECAQLATTNAADWRGLVAGLSDGDLESLITYRNSSGVEFTTSLEDILIHVGMHGAYHRGQVAAMLRSAGETPSPTDYIQWVRGVLADSTTVSQRGA
ncbi:MAG: DinB family protein [Gemmatimonadaceae bacterium]